MRVFEDVAELKAAVGEHLGRSAWVEVSAERVRQFEAAVTGQAPAPGPDRDVAASVAEPVPGALVLAMGTLLLPTVMQLEGIRFAVNYGLEGLRFLRPVPVGSRIRASLDLHSVTDVPGGVHVVGGVVFEVEGREDPTCEAQPSFRYYL